MSFFLYWLFSTVTKSSSIITGADLHRGVRQVNGTNIGIPFYRYRLDISVHISYAKLTFFLGCSESGSSSSSSEETIPDFPPLTTPLPSPVGSPRITGEGGSAFSVGDVVWGKIQGFPWWPGKVVTNIRLPDYHQYLKWDCTLTWVIRISIIYYYSITKL